MLTIVLHMHVLLESVLMLTIVLHMHVLLESVFIFPFQMFTTQSKYFHSVFAGLIDSYRNKHGICSKYVMRKL